jgi:hypothetical protein
MPVGGGGDHPAHSRSNWRAHHSETGPARVPKSHKNDATRIMTSHRIGAPLDKASPCASRRHLVLNGYCVVL